MVESGAEAQKRSSGKRITIKKPTLRPAVALLGRWTAAGDHFEDCLVQSNSMVVLRTAKIRMISNT
jgi:hypothetical protein